MTPSQVPWNMEDRRCQLMPVLFGRYYHFSELLIPLHILTLFPLRDCKLPNHFSFSLNTALMDTCKHTTLPISLMVSLGQISSQWEPQGEGRGLLRDGYMLSSQRVLALDLHSRQ